MPKRRACPICMAKANLFQVKLEGMWKDYDAAEDKILKRAYLAGFPHVRYVLRGHEYEIDFKEMKQKNKDSTKERQIRPPHKWRAPAEPIVPKGPTTCIKVPPGSPGTTIQVPHPRAPGKFISVAVPASARVGQAMLVPVPPVEEVPAEPPAASAPEPSAPTTCDPTPASPEPAPAEPVPAAATAGAPAAKKSSGYSTGAKVAMGTTAAVAVGGVAVAGAMLGEHIAEEGWDATMADLGDTADVTGAAVVHGGEAAVEWIKVAAEDTGAFLMDLF